MASQQSFTEAEILSALRSRFTDPGNGGSGRYAFMTHVRTGASWNQQEIDAVVLALWPSDQHALMGFEVKCSRADWLREIKPDTSKSARARMLCDSFTIVAPLNVVVAAELPVGWGLLAAIRTDGGSVHLRSQVVPGWVRAAEGKIDRSFLAALLRAAGAVPGMRSGLKRARAAAHEDAR